MVAASVLDGTSQGIRGTRIVKELSPLGVIGLDSVRRVR